MVDFHDLYHDLRIQRHNQDQIHFVHQHQCFQFLEHVHRHKQHQSSHQSTEIWQQMVLNQNEVTLVDNVDFKRIY